MFGRIAVITLMAFIATTEGGRVLNGYKAKWAEDPADGFYDLPQSLRDAESQGWTKISGVGMSRSVKPLGYYGDPRFVILFSIHTGKVLGHQVGFPVADMKDVPIDYAANPAITKKTLNSEEYYTGTTLYTRNGDKLRVWFEVNGEFVEYPTEPELIVRDTPFFSKRCFPMMGLHFYQINSTTNCNNIFPWALLRIDNDIVGIGFEALGNSTNAPKRTWFEILPLELVANTIPDAATCIGEGLVAYGLTSFHVWFKKDPENIVCADDCKAVINSTYTGGKKSYVDSSTRKKRSEGPANVCPVPISLLRGTRKLVNNFLKILL